MKSFSIFEKIQEKFKQSFEWSLLSTDSRRVVVSYKRKYVHKVLVNHIVKLAQEKSVVM